MFFSKKLKISDAVLEKVQRACELIGASSVEEFAERVLDAEAQKILAQQARPELSADEIDDITKKLQGLGYLE